MMIWKAGVQLKQASITAKGTGPGGGNASRRRSWLLVKTGMAKSAF